MSSVLHFLHYLHSTFYFANTSALYDNIHKMVLDLHLGPKFMAMAGLILMMLCGFFSNSLNAAVMSDGSISAKPLLRNLRLLHDNSRDVDELQDFSLIGSNNAENDKHK